MTILEIEQAAMRGYELPDNLTQPEQLLFLSLRILYRQVREKQIDREAGTTEKRKLIKEFEIAKFSYELSVQTAQMRNKLSTYLCEINKNGCPMCKKAVEIFDGRDRELEE